jgi:hypothetical protein
MACKCSIIAVKMRLVLRYVMCGLFNKEVIAPAIVVKHYPDVCLSSCVKLKPLYVSMFGGVCEDALQWKTAHCATITLSICRKH